MLKTRIVTALLLVAAFLAILFVLPVPGAQAAFAIIAALAAWEWGGLMQDSRRGRLLFASGVLASCLVLALLPATLWPSLWLAAALFWLGIAPLWLKRRWTLDCLGRATGWIVLVPTWAALADLHRRSPWLLLAVMALVWVADIAAYFAGRAWGRHKLAPLISPGKTWEGVAGALVGVLAYGLALQVWLPQLLPIGPLAPLSLGIALVGLTALSIVGDLFESLLKRQAGRKDSSQLLPGHGGILDRIDSQTSTLPLIALALYWVAP